MITKNLLIYLVIVLLKCSVVIKAQFHFAPPVPGLPPNTDPTIIPTRTTPSSITGPLMLSESYLPAVMQAIAYYVELLQYEIPEMTTIEPPFSLSENDDLNLAVTNAPSTSQMPTQPALDSTTNSHRPGYYAPIVPPINIKEPITTGVLKPAFTKPEKPLIGLLPLLSISSSDYFDWYLNNIKFKNSPQVSEYILQDLNLLPSGLLQDIAKEHYEQPALLDTENVNEFLKVYDDFYSQRNQPVTGRKKIPPTKPYVQMLMLYDLLKREAKKQMLNKFVGYSHAMLIELNKTAEGSAERQLYTLMKRLIDRGDIDKPDIKSRIQSMMDDLANPYSVTAKAMRYLPPLPFLL